VSWIDEGNLIVSRVAEFGNSPGLRSFRRAPTTITWITVRPAKVRVRRWWLV